MSIGFVLIWAAIFFSFNAIDVHRIRIKSKHAVHLMNENVMKMKMLSDVACSIMPKLNQKNQTLQL